MALQKKKEPTKKYVVVKPHTLNHFIGDKIDLTERQAKNLVGKVRLASELAGSDGAKASPAELKKLAAAEKQVEELSQQVADLEAANAELTKQLEEAIKKS